MVYPPSAMTVEEKILAALARIELSSASSTIWIVESKLYNKT
jgi:hypothetical protein